MRWLKVTIALVVVMVLAWLVVSRVVDDARTAAARLDACHLAQRDRLADFSQRAAALIEGAELQPADQCVEGADAQLSVTAPVDLRLADVQRLYTTAGWAPRPHDRGFLLSPDRAVTASFWYVGKGVPDARTSQVIVTMQDIDFRSERGD